MDWPFKSCRNYLKLCVSETVGLKHLTCSEKEIDLGIPAGLGRVWWTDSGRWKEIVFWCSWCGSRLCCFWRKCWQKESSCKVSPFSRMNLMFTKIWSHSRGFFEALGRGPISYSLPPQQAGCPQPWTPRHVERSRKRLEKSPRGRCLGCYLLNYRPWVVISGSISLKDSSWSRLMSRPRVSWQGTRGQFHFSFQPYFTEDLALIFTTLLRFSPAGSLLSHRILVSLQWYK